MYMLLLQIYSKTITSLRFTYAIQQISQKYVLHFLCSPQYATNVDTWDAFTREFLKQKLKVRDINKQDLKSLCVRNIIDEKKETKEILKMSPNDLNTALLNQMSKNKDSIVTRMIMECIKLKKVIDHSVTNKLFQNYSQNGRPDIVETLVKYTSEVDPHLHRLNGQFLHYLAKAQCMKGNSDKGLAILSECYETNKALRSTYRIIFRDLIQDSVQNRSEASLVIFRKYVMEFSKKWGDDYPLICFWHICWSSSWFSDQMLASELLESSVELQKIVRDKSTELSISILREEYNDDAVVRLLQALLKYNMMAEYVKVLQILFNFKLNQGDIRGCSEILHNCQALGLTLPADQRGRYLRLLISGKFKEQPTKVPVKNFKLKF